MEIKTTLVPGVPWPEVGEWPEKPKFKHESKPVRVVAKKKKAPAKAKPVAKRVREKQALTEAVIKDGVFTHPKADPLAEARSQLDHISKQRAAIKKLDLAPREFFIFQKAKAST